MVQLDLFYRYTMIWLYNLVHTSAQMPMNVMISSIFWVVGFGALVKINNLHFLLWLDWDTPKGRALKISQDDTNAKWRSILGFTQGFVGLIDSPSAFQWIFVDFVKSSVWHIFWRPVREKKNVGKKDSANPQVVHLSRFEVEQQRMELLTFFKWRGRSLSLGSFWVPQRDASKPGVLWYLRITSEI